MRLLVTADLHYNHRRSTSLADSLIDQMNAIAHVDALLVIGDTAAYDGDALERCLSRFTFAGPKLFVAGNHELWTHGPDSYSLFKHDLPRRVRAMGWRWLQDEPFVDRAAGMAIVGSVGWYDYSFAVAELNVPRRFYERGVSPGAANRLEIALDTSDVTPAAMEIVARWNDAKFVKLHRSDDAFLDELLAQMTTQLDALRDVPHVVAAIHHVPFAQLLPPRHGGQWDFARAYLGSPKIGELLLRYPNVRHAMCGHSHVPMERRIAHLEAINIGSGYRQKQFRVLQIDP